MARLVMPPEHRVTLAPLGYRFDCAGDRDLLSAIRGRGLAVRWACRNGVCELCTARLVSGETLNTRTGAPQKPPESVLLCRSHPLTDLILHTEDLMAAGQQEPRELACQVTEVALMGEDVYRVRLRPLRGKLPLFYAGQYLAIHLPDAEPAWFSIASAPGADDLVLHIQAPISCETAAGIIGHLKTERRVTVTLPYGEACVTGLPDRPLLLVVAGTGFAQAKSVIEYLMAHGSDQPIFLYWGVRRHEDMYLRALADQWDRQWPNFHFRTVVGDDEDHGWSGHHAQLVQALQADGHRLERVTVLASGSPAMVYSVLDTLTDAGLPASQFLSDVLQYAPRD